MNKDDIQFKLLAGMPIPFENGQIHSPKLRDIADIGLSKYNEFLTIMFFDKSMVEVITEEELTDFELLFLLSYQDKEFKAKLYKAFDFFLKETPERHYNDDGAFFLFKKNDWTLSNNNFGQFQNMIEIINNTKKPVIEEYRPANSKAREVIEKIKSFTVPKKKDEITLTGIVNALAWRNNGTNIKEIFDLTIYQLYQAFFATENIDNYMSTLQGIYAGAIDSKKIKNIQKIHWAKEIKL